MSRPALLFPLFADIKSLDGIGPKSATALEAIHVAAPRDLLYVMPHTGHDRRLRRTIKDAPLRQVATTTVTVLSHQKTSISYNVFVADAEVEFQLSFFHARAAYLEQLLPVGARRVVSGKVEEFRGHLQMVHPDHVLPEDQIDELPDYEPVYPLTGSITQKTMWRATRAALARIPDVPEWIDPSQCARAQWPDFQQAMLNAHNPNADSDLALTSPARERLAYDEFMAHQLTLALARLRARRASGRPTAGDHRLRDRMLAALPYEPTGAQRRAVQEIAADMAADQRMNRLLQGDVGSGKTLVAFLALLVAVEAGGQGVLMAPTEILARQHLEGLLPLAEHVGVVLEILTGRDKGAERKAKLAALQRGDIHVLVGTHAVFQADVAFHDLRLAIVDEQHRFGVRQRLELGKKGDAVDMLVMTATPIPRSLSLAQYGDMDVSVLDEKPPGRKPIQTVLVSTGRMDEVVDRLRAAIAEGRQCYWVCPLVEDSEVSDLTSAEDRFKRLRAALGEGVVGLVHGQMPPADKDAAMARFQDGQTSVLVATTVIEVGVNVPNASIMVIERAENFGLAQLHQLRGRVGRGTASSTCLLMYQPPLGETGRKRLEVLRETEDGFRIAEVDLQMRGAGDVLGTAQSGLPRFHIADLEVQADLMATAQSDARKLLSDDPDLTSERGEAARVLLWLMRQDDAIRLMSAG